MKPICVPCQRFFRPRKTGFYFTEGMPIATEAPPGTAAPEQWKPYKVWSGDMWECQGCKAVVVVGCGFQPVAVQHQQDFERLRTKLKADQFQVNDC